MLFAVALVGISCFSFKKSGAALSGDPTSIFLKDVARSITLVATRNGNVWNVSGQDASNYLKMIANESLGKDIDAVTDLIIEFDAAYTNGVIAGWGMDAAGNKIPLGAQYQRTAEAPASTLYLKEEHTCAGSPCPCCAFVISEGTIIKCVCDRPGCNPDEGSKCDHTVKVVIDQ